MYLPKHFEVSEDDTAALLSKGGFGHLVTPAPDGSMEVTSMPLLYDADRHSLVGHMSRPNPHWQYTAEAESVVVIPVVDAYVTPEYYPSKKETEKVVPTWNYQIINVYGQLQAHDDRDWLLDHVTKLTNHHEVGRPKEWKVTDAPEKFIAMQLKGIVGVELSISRVVAKAKLNQNRTAEDRTGVIRGLEQGTRPEQETAAHMVAIGLDNG
ncbi:FMN-binding negative transcriptional regulator [Saccharopolyspora sp. NPDC050389]|uniref:FMN-binding negative transcriptional regulator n=1 Tax=Saccharopolyspora sp. NPDC050389 TaxID=3155516 RepID=UPI0033F79CA7